MVHSKFYSSLLDQLSIVAITDRSGKIVYANDKFCSISGYKREELIGVDHRIINSSYHPKSFFINLWKTVSSGQTWRGEIKNKAKDGTFYWVDTFIVPRLNEDQKISRYYSIRLDITERKLKESELNDIRVLQSHQVRKPVANMLGLMELIETEELNESSRFLYDLLKKSIMELEDSIMSIVKHEKSSSN